MTTITGLIDGELASEHLTDPCPACKGKGFGVFQPKGELKYSGACPECKGSGKTNERKA